jgi:hypothetical protein
MFRAGHPGELGRVPGSKEGSAVYIGIGTVVLIAIIVLIVLALRR